MANGNTPPVINPTVDVGELLSEVIGDTGAVQSFLGGYRIRVFHTGAFPWEEAVKVLVFRDFKIYITRKKAEIVIEAQP